MPRINQPVDLGPDWIFRRECGIFNTLGARQRIAKQLYTSLICLPTVFHCHSLPDTPCGVFSLEYSPDGSVLIAAYQSNDLVILDPADTKRGRCISRAHNDCVNCVKFLDNNTFATGSDDTRVVLWDIRNSKNSLRTFSGHENWVKSIDYSPEHKQLITSGFDGTILGWDLSKNIETDTNFQKFFSMNGLMRTRLSPDRSKLLISTTGGYIIIIHNLDLTTLKEDLKKFKPNLYRLMQMSQTILRPSKDFTHKFRGAGKRNRVEFICDFPEGNDAEVIASIQIHPEGHSVLSRNSSQGDASEWTCVHNIEENLNDFDNEITERCVEYVSKSTHATHILTPTAEDGDEEVEDSTDDLAFSPADVWEAMVVLGQERFRRTVGWQPGRPRRQSPSPEESEEDDGDDADEGGPRRRRRHMGRHRRRLRTMYEANVMERNGQPSSDRRQPERVLSLGVYQPVVQGSSVRRRNVATLTITSSDTESDSDASRQSIYPPERDSAAQSREDFMSSLGRIKVNKNIHQNIKRLAYYIEEPNHVLGYIKEPCFSPDGRAICSPYRLGVRLLSFSPDFHLPWQCYPETPPSLLHVVATERLDFARNDAIVSSKFSPTGCQLAVGSLEGNVYTFDPFR